VCDGVSGVVCVSVCICVTSMCVWEKGGSGVEGEVCVCGSMCVVRVCMCVCVVGYRCEVRDNIKDCWTNSCGACMWWLWL